MNMFRPHSSGRTGFYRSSLSIAVNLFLIVRIWLTLTEGEASRFHVIYFITSVCSVSGVSVQNNVWLNKLQLNVKFSCVWI